MLIFEPDFGGHRLQYVRAIVDALASLPVSTVVVCERGTRRSEEFATHLAGLGDAVEFDESVSDMRGRRAHAVGMLRFLALQRAIRRHGPDHVYIPYADGLIQVAGAARAVGWSLSRRGMETEALMMRGRFAYRSPAMTMGTRLLIRILDNAPVDIVHHLDPIVYDYLRQHHRGLSRRLRLLPEAVEPIRSLDVRSARLQLGIDPAGHYVGCLGALSAGKGTARLLKAFSQRAAAVNTRLLLVGKSDPELRSLLDREHRADLDTGRIVHIDRYVTQEEFHLGILASDVVCAPYLRQIGSSGLVVRAAAAGRVLLGADFGWIGRVIREFGLGVVCDVEDPAQFAAAIARALTLSEGYRPGPAARRFADFHRMDNFGWHWTRRLRERLGMASPAGCTGWQWPTPALTG